MCVCLYSIFKVEEKPDVTYADVGGCKEQIEKLREVVETPLLHVGFNLKIFIDRKMFGSFFDVCFYQD